MCAVGLLNRSHGLTWRRIRSTRTERERLPVLRHCHDGTGQRQKRLRSRTIGTWSHSNSIRDLGMRFRNAVPPAQHAQDGVLACDEAHAILGAGRELIGRVARENKERNRLVVLADELD
jgi:hypothetical protein